MYCVGECDIFGLEGGDHLVQDDDQFFTDLCEFGKIVLCWVLDKVVGYLEKGVNNLMNTEMFKVDLFNIFIMKLFFDEFVISLHLLDRLLQCIKRNRCLFLTIV